MSSVSESALISSLFHVSSPTRSSSSTSSALFFVLTTVLNSLRFCSKQRLVVEVPSLSMGQFLVRDFEVFESDMKKSVRGRKVRIIVSDPYATDDSSSDEWFECKPPKVKRIVHEINLPFQLSESSQYHKSCRRKAASMQLNKPVGVRLRQSGKWAAEIRNPLTKTKVWLGTYATLEEAGKAYADKKVEFDASVASANSQCLRSAASKEKVSLSKDVAASGDLTKEGFDLSQLEIPDLSFLAAEEKSGAKAAGEIDFDCFFKDEDYDHLFDDFSVVDNVNNISLPSELPDCDFTDVELEHGDMKFAFADQLAHPPLNIACP
ncbi:hypothetical protein F2Q70_00020718 [Brassica cretica]|uniref:AP2/ERF domain-containing protein n=1 Tax=Brassica cretica TaxID=69181 RepID=A0A8S9GTT9_BRACR|nr:hypothetical protein F2Q70_00020718 [Brassica cretica]